MTENSYSKHLFFTHSKMNTEQSCPFGILIGSVGTGKTTLFNKLVNKNQIDQDIEFSEATHCIYGQFANQKKFRIIDSLGSCDENTKSMNALSLKLAQIEGTINRIFLLIKYERLGPMQNKFSEQIYYLQDWKKFITVVITHWDREDTPENRKSYENIKAMLTDNDPDSDLQYPFIFVGKESNNQQLQEVFYNNLCQSNPIGLEIELPKLKLSLNENMHLFINQQKQKFNMISDSVFKKMIKHNQNDKKKLLEDFIQNVSFETQNLINNFLNKYRKEITEIEINLYFLEIKMYIFKTFENINSHQNQSFTTLKPINKKKRSFFSSVCNKFTNFIK
ncbi:50S ribosome-binding GTPase (macronuclear) [Tetrahymena thermophila SB210]|uniref:50S ribosome-binding GTPase n=1 Tax=Tetrahymena thermophila (strain SB210) TaxID=312017 RepID=Q24FH1_TETTS|nr:50S ribosome-binding GTPase [Tetrahymena thermophila SB210]EAS06487.2 50S ribosome-binding GTPase [Tetrahymena thermophila SB210]|eukprot:XP_001026732.2 50S ribosome-binding GTPase [Tetrahymena thermophila SB210]